MRAGTAIIITLGALAPVAAQVERLGHFEWAAELSAEERAKQHIDDQEAHSGKYSLRYQTAATDEYPACEFILVADTFETAEFEVEAWIKVEGEGSLCLVYPDDGRTGFEVIESPTDGWQPLKLHLRANPTREGDENCRSEVNVRLKGASGKVTWWLDDVFVTPLYQHQIPKTGNPPVVDGDLSDACWNDEAYVGDPYWRMYNKPQDAQEPTHVWCCYDDEHLYVAFRCVTRGPDRLVAKVDKHDGPAWRDDSAEIFFNPSHDHARYYEYIVTPRDVVFDSKWWREGGAWQVDWHYFGEWKAAVEKDAWTVEIALELRSYEERDLQGNPTGYMALPTGDVAGILFSRNDRVLEEGMSWADCIGSFHEVDQYGHLVGFRPLYTEGYRKTALREMKRLESRWRKMHAAAGYPEPIPARENRPYHGTEGLPEAIAALRRRVESDGLSFDAWVGIGKEAERLDTWLNRARGRLARVIARQKWSQAGEGGRDQGWGIAVLSPMEPLQCPPWPQMPTNTLAVPDVVRISAARGESEPIHLILYSWDELGVRAWLIPSPLRCAGEQIGASNVRIYEAGSLRPCDSVRVSPSDPAEVWVVVEVPREARPGVYRGQIKTPASARGRHMYGEAGLPIELTVRDFALPKRPSLPVSVGFDQRWIASRWYGRAERLNPDKYWLFALELLRHRVMPREMLADYTEWTREGLDFSIADQMLARGEMAGLRPEALIAARPGHLGLVSDRPRVLRQVIHHWRERSGVAVIPTYVWGGGWLFKDLTDADRRLAVAAVRAAEDLQDVRRAAARVGVWALAPEIATGLSGARGEGQFAPASLASAAASTEKKTVWRVANPCSEMSGIEMRMLLWLAYDYRVHMVFMEFVGRGVPYPVMRTASGLLYCCEGATSVHKDGRLRVDPPRPTLHLELLREGLEDYEYLHMLAQLNRRLGKIGGAQKHTRLQRENSWLLKLDYRIIKNVRSYTHDPEVIMQWREALARQIERTRDVLRRHGEEGLPGD